MKKKAKDLKPGDVFRLAVFLNFPRRWYKTVSIRPSVTVPDLVVLSTLERANPICVYALREVELKEQVKP